MRAGCIICGDHFLPNIEVSATPCGHVFHTICVAQWFERSKTCPQCRFSCKQKLLRLYFDEGSAEDNNVDPDTLQHHLDNAKFQLKLKEQELRNCKEDVEKEKEISRRLREDVVSREDKEKAQATLIDSLRTKIQYLGYQKDLVERLTVERDTARAKLESMQELERLLVGSENDVQDVLAKYGDTGTDASKNLATVCVLLTREMKDMSEKTKYFRNEAKKSREELKRKNRLLLSSQSVEKSLEQEVSQLKKDIKYLEEENFSLSKKINILEASLASPSGNPVKGALQRLLHENVTPARLKRHFSVDCSSDEMISKAPRLQPSECDKEMDITDDIACEILNESVDLFENSEVGTDPPAESKRSRTDELLKQYELDETAYMPSSSSSPYLQVKSGSLYPIPSSFNSRPAPSHNPPPRNIFSKKKSAGFSKPVVRTEQPLKKRSYDGLGGHQKEDHVPRPAPVVIKKRTTATKLRTGSSATVKTISDFFKNTFDDDGC
ncbi:Zinc finger RING-type [Trinorchestia longiramus]|nr:Zinc finger RING-type [Trinorchestia longiramus]